MQRVLTSWYSQNLGKEMEIAVYGYYGPALLMFPSAAADYLEYERFGLIEAAGDAFESGKMKGFSINSINSESWLNDRMSGQDKAIRHQMYNRYITEEVVPFIAEQLKTENPEIYTTGVSLGAFHAANTFFRRPDLINGTIGMSGIYDLKSYSNGHFDENVYYNSPIDYLPNLEGPYLKQLRQREKIIFLSGKGDYEDPGASVEIASVLNDKGIHSKVELWDEKWTHDWPTWRAMLPSVIERHF